MASNNTLSPLAESVITQFSATLTGRYFELSAAVLFLYGYLLTLPDELRYIWRGNLNIMKFFLLVNRYFSLILVCTEILLYFAELENNTKCHALYYTEVVTDILISLATYSIFILRTYAIYGRSRIIFLLLAIPLIANFSANIWLAVVQAIGAYPPELQVGPFTCFFYETSSSGLVADLACAASNAIFDILVVILTVNRTAQLAIESRRAKVSGSISLILLRDGTLYYSAIFIPQVVIIVLSLIGSITDNSNLIDVTNSLSYIFTSLQSIMVNMLVFSLSVAANEREDTEFRTRTGLEPPAFATGPVLSNIGGPVRTFPDDFDYDISEDDEVVNTEMAEDTMMGLPIFSEMGDGVCSSPEQVGCGMNV